MEAVSNHLADQAAIFQTWLRLSTAWRAGDVEGVTSVFDRECDHRVLTTDARMRRGRHEIERSFADAFAQRARREGRNLTFTFTSMRFISGDIAIVDGVLTFGPGARSDGRSLPSGSEPFAAVMKQDSAGWLIAACRFGTLATAR
jgi:uncharacterized protein (TIGR02246 family)